MNEGAKCSEEEKVWPRQVAQEIGLAPVLELLRRMEALEVAKQ